MAEAWLAIDAGNTRIKWALHDGKGWVARGVAMTVEAASVAAQWPEMPPGTPAIASNVAGPAVADTLRAGASGRGLSLRFIASTGLQCGVTSRYREPAQLGTDRWAALVAAHGSRPCDQLVVNAGTALTIDALTRDGQFLGGVIAPGPALMRRSLDRGTAGLRLTEGHFADFPLSTPDAITSGAIQACAGAVARMAEAMARHGHAPERVVLSGGAAAELAPHLPLSAAIEENLVLDGLLLIARDA